MEGAIPSEQWGAGATEAKESSFLKKWNSQSLINGMVFCCPLGLQDRRRCLAGPIYGHFVSKDFVSFGAAAALTRSEIQEVRCAGSETDPKIPTLVALVFFFQFFSIPSGNQTWQWKIHYSKLISNCHVWLPEGSHWANALFDHEKKDSDDHKADNFTAKLEVDHLYWEGMVPLYGHPKK